MPITETIDETFATLAKNYDEQVGKTADRIPGPGGAIVRRVGAIQAEAIRQYGLFVLTTFDAAERFTRAAFTGVTNFAETATNAAEDSASTLRNLGERAFHDIEDTAKTVERRARGAAQSIERRFAVVKGGAEALEDDLEDAAGSAGAQVGKAADTAVAEVADEGANRPGGAYETWTKDELYERAQDIDLDGRSNMTKDELIHALRSA